MTETIQMTMMMRITTEQMTINKMVIDRWSDNCTRGEQTARRHRLGQTIPEDIADSLQKVVALWIDKRAEEKTNGQGVDKEVRG